MCRRACGLDDAFPPFDLCSCVEALVVIYIYLYICILYTSPVIGRIHTYARSVVRYWWSCTITVYRTVLGECAVPVLKANFCFLWFTNCVLLCDKQSNTRMLVTFGICLKQHFNTRYLAFYNLAPPRIFLPLDLLSEYRIQHGAMGPF